ncbi:MAG: LysM peptidoglycan-binding domain-containing protein [Alicyclobacillus sp.]|nr:LysM peptidoglycan-binding domain-containing protein [Alicyclobacillus sp.]
MRHHARRFAVSTLASLFMGVSAAQAATVTVQPGDSLWRIAIRHHTTVAALKASNPTMSSTQLQPGVTLQLPIPYVVRPGDSLWRIGRKYGVTVSALRSANPDVKAANLPIGSVLQVPGSTKSGIGVSQTDLYWLAHLIHAEADAESLTTQIAVGDVVLHRVWSSKYPDSVAGVVFQVSNGHYQFECVRNGYIYKQPDSKNYQAAMAVLENGKDVVPGALVFYNPAKTSAGSWVWQEPVIATLGHLTFAK